MSRHYEIVTAVRASDIVGLMEERGFSQLPEKTLLTMMAAGIIVASCTEQDPLKDYSDRFQRTTEFVSTKQPTRICIGDHWDYQSAGADIDEFGIEAIQLTAHARASNLFYHLTKKYSTGQSHLYAVERQSRGEALMIRMQTLAHHPK